MASSRAGLSSGRKAGWLVLTALICVAGYDGVKTGLAASGVKDNATQVAHDAANYYHAHPDVNATYTQAVTEAVADGDTLPVDNFIVTSAGAVTLTLVRSNTTLLLGRIHAPLDTMTGQATSTWAP